MAVAASRQPRSTTTIIQGGAPGETMFGPDAADLLILERADGKRAVIMLQNK